MTDLTIPVDIFTVLTGCSVVFFLFLALAAFLPVDWALPSLFVTAP